MRYIDRQAERERKRDRQNVYVCMREKERETRKCTQSVILQNFSLASLHFGKVKKKKYLPFCTAVASLVANLDWAPLSLTSPGSVNKGWTSPFAISVNFLLCCNGIY